MTHGRRFICLRSGEPENVETGNQSHFDSRKQQVAEFIRANGPSTRSEILAGTDVPEGTIRYCLKDETRFVRDKDGKWRNVEAATAEK